ncbi:J domain-containing protein [Ramlibacter sp.]|uniref:J domain-containing protein n=1 Tax=Ramlibacter sp. TaxID=1917967 RepID=UPI002FCB79FC
MSAKGQPSLYDVLGLAPGASAQDVRQAWRRLAQQHHPDRGEAADTEAMALINQAYEVLSDPDRRARYDHGRTRPSEPRQPGRVELPGDRAKVRLAWAAAGLLAVASAAWALVQGLGPGQSDAPLRAADGASTASARPQALPAAVHAPKPLPVQDAQPGAESPLRLIPARRLEEHSGPARRP